MARLLARLLAALDAVSRAAVVVSFCAMVAVVAAQVLLRYAFNDSIDWAEDIARLVFVWMMFLAIPLGVRGGVHIGVNLLVQRLPPAVGEPLHRATSLAGLALMTIVAIGAARLLPEQWDELLPTVSVSVGWMLVPVCLGAVHSALHLAALVLGGAPRETILSAE